MLVPVCPKEATWKAGEERWDSREHVKWPEGIDKPRVCSHCGSIHPEDLILLFEQGWELEPTGTCYKYYIHPPGYAEEVYRMSHAIIAEKLDSFVHKVPPIVPVVKLYIPHVTSEIEVALNREVLGYVERKVKLELENDTSKQTT